MTGPGPGLPAQAPAQSPGLSPEPEGYGSPVPWAWMELLANHREARAARPFMRAPDVSPEIRDQATVAYCKAVDAMVEALDALDAARVPGRITAFLAKRERS